jgi:hypothetical protein
VKHCGRCDINKPDDEFYRRNKDGGLQSHCKKCDKARADIWRRNHLGAHAGFCREWQKNNPLRVRIAEWRRQGIVITTQEYMDKFNAQGGKCAVCKTHESDLERKLAVDHEHSTGKVRGLLCHTCNRSIVSVLENKPNLIPVAQAYLDEYRRK